MEEVYDGGFDSGGEDFCADLCFDGHGGGSFFGSGMGQGAFGERGGFCAECADESGDGAAGGGRMR